jgi:hypothetical protein
MPQLHPLTRWTDSKLWQIAIGIIIIIGADLVLHSFEFVKAQDESHIIATVMASPAMDNHVRAVNKEQVSLLVENVNFLLLCNYEKLSAAEIVRMKARAKAMSFEQQKQTEQQP